MVGGRGEVRDIQSGGSVKSDRSSATTPLHLLCALRTESLHLAGTNVHLTNESPVDCSRK